MTVDWQKVLGALGDFVTIMLPGMILIFTVINYFGGSALFPMFFSDGRFKLGDSSETWTVFLVASYFAGHIVFLLGSRLDDRLFDPFRKKTKLGFIRELANGKTPAIGGVGACLARAVFGKDPDEAAVVAERLKIMALGEENHAAMNAYKWCKIRLSGEGSDGIASVLRFEADSKFFRSLIVIMPVAIWALWEGPRWPRWIALGLTLLIVWRYLEQRSKATEEAFTQVIAMEAAKLGPREGARDGPLVGAVVYRKDKQKGTGREEFRYLLVQAKSQPSEWVLPKGHVELGENHRQTAVRETLEETGVWGRVRDFLSEQPIGKPPRQVPYYLLERVDPWPWPVRLFCKLVASIKRDLLGLTPPERRRVWPEDRKHCWQAYEAARASASFEEAHQLLQEAARKVGDPAAPTQVEGKA
jgi:8-oxo-dGTP pyrophosphatase MutT (NUDIX family)